MTDYASLIPVNVITGFLGSGKTTLLQDLMASPRLRNTAVLVNELGEVGLDHHLLSHVAEGALLLDNGCICCAMRGDLQEALRGLFSSRERGEIPPFERVVIETSGLADPVPIAFTVVAEPVIQHHFRLGNVITVVDAVNAPAQLERHPQSAKQIAVADRLVVTKTDLCPPSQATALGRSLSRLNPAAPQFRTAADPIDPDVLLIEDVYDEASKQREVRRWLDGEAGELGRGTPHGHGHGTDDGISSFCLIFDEPLDWTAFGIWLTMLLNRRGEDVLRVKGMLNVVDAATPVLINGVQHIVHPPVHLGAWPDADRRSRIVFIGRDLPRAHLEASLAAFNALANPRRREPTLAADGAGPTGALAATRPGSV